MSYVATKKFSNTPVGTEDQTDYMPGDPVPDFESWPEHARIVLLRQHFVTPNFGAIAADATSTAEDAEVGETAESRRRGSGKLKR